MYGLTSQTLELDCWGSNSDFRILCPCDFGASVSLHELQIAAAPTSLTVLRLVRHCFRCGGSKGISHILAPLMLEAHRCGNERWRCSAVSAL